MGKKEIVERFLSDGYGLDAAALQFFVEAPEKAEAFLSSKRKAGKEPGRPAIVTLDYVKKALESQPETPAPCAAKVLEDFNRPLGKISVEDATSSRSKEYEQVMKILSGKLEGLLSVNKIQRQQKFSLIVSLVEKTGACAAVVEDATGTTTLNFDNAELDEMIEGDIFGVECESTGEQPAVKKIFWPDIPLKRNIGTPGKRILCVFVSGCGRREAGFKPESFEKFVKWIGENAGKAEAVHVIAFSKQDRLDATELLSGLLPAEVCKSVVPMPSIADVAGLKIMSCESESLSDYTGVWGSEEKAMTNLLKRRILPLRKAGRRSAGSYATTFDEVPDVFIAAGSKEPSTSNYKGTILIGIGSFSDVPTFFTVGTEARDVNKLDLS